MTFRRCCYDAVCPKMFIRVTTTNENCLRGIIWCVGYVIPFLHDLTKRNSRKALSL